MTNDFYNASILPYAGIIIKICRAYTHSQADFEDYYQEVCLQIWRSRDRFKGDSEWSTWIYRLSLNVCLTLFKKHKKGEHLKSELDADKVIEEVTPFKDTELNQLYQAIKQLSEVDRALILLYLEEQTYQQIAQIFDIKANNVGVRISRIKERLRRILDDKVD